MAFLFNNSMQNFVFPEAKKNWSLPLLMMFVNEDILPCGGGKCVSWGDTEYIAVEQIRAQPCFQEHVHLPTFLWTASSSLPSSFEFILLHAI